MFMLNDNIQIKKETLVGRHTCILLWREENVSRTIPKRFQDMPRRSVTCSSSSSSLASSTSVSPASAWKQQPGPDHVWDLLITCILYMVHQNNYLRYIQYMIYIYIVYIYTIYVLFGYLMRSPIRVGYCVQVRVNVGRCTTDYWWKCGIGAIFTNSKRRPTTVYCMVTGCVPHAKPLKTGC